METVLEDGLDSLVAPDAVRRLDLTEGVVERVDDLVDCLACVGISGLQPHNPSVEVPRERPEHMNVKGVLGGYAQQVGGGRGHLDGGDTDDHGSQVPSLDSLLSSPMRKP